jgi:hypothetical protein
MAPDWPVSQDIPDITDVYERFAALTAESAELGGYLLLYAGLDRGGIALTMAANIAGAASLGLEADVARGKAAIRSGACDFLVNTLDEALRILKNEIRKKKPVSVALVGDPRAAVAEMVDRGVQPELVDGTVPGMEMLEERGARRLGPAAGFGEGVSWSVDREPVRWLPVVDTLAVEALDPADKTTPARRRWIEGAPRYLGRALSGQRYLPMSAVEGDAFAEAVSQAVVGVAVKVSRRPGSQSRVP